MKIAVVLEENYERAVLTFKEYMTILVSTLQDLGYACTLHSLFEEAIAQKPNIILGVALPHNSNFNQLRQLIDKHADIFWMMYGADQLPQLEHNDDDTLKILTNIRLQRMWTANKPFLDMFDCVLDPFIGNINFLRAHGHKAYHLPFGYHSKCEWDDIKEDKDIDILHIGVTNCARRKRVLCRLEQNARKRRWRFLAVESAFGETYKRLLKRSKILINIHNNEAQYFNGMKFIAHCFSNKVLVVSEPCTYREPFQNGIHYVEADGAGAMYKQIDKYLRHPEKSQKITDQAYTFVCNQYTLKGHLSDLFCQINK